MCRVARVHDSVQNPAAKTYRHSFAVGVFAWQPRQAGRGKNTVSSGFEGPWTRSPSRWNYDFFDALLSEEWVPAKSPYGADQWHTRNETSKFARTMRLTADVSLVADKIYRPIVEEYAADHAQFDADFADAWFKLVHRSEDHPHKDDLEKEAGVCTSFEFTTLLP
ncbi:katG [Symbiodinium necroappetens]|uniref:KatG protein n=1 Tax=Symbiodinium necroappetens TaxID=1628268 RepID=A0A812YWA8_9DINO|nr:katG [Symbiodinium necroappetens]